MKKKKRSKLVFIPLIVMSVVLSYIIVTGIDSLYDMDACKNEFVDMIGSYDFQEKNNVFWRFDSAFANDDFWIINSGENIRCTVFWIGWINNDINTEDLMAKTDFISGHLTEENIIQSKYW